MIHQLKEILENSSNIVFFGGAGVSTESNIPDFRSAHGLYNTKMKIYHSPDVLLSHHFFNNHPLEFWDFYKKNLLYPSAKPNLAHKALVMLEQANKLTGIITQNIDGLHQLAGSKNVIELHGSIHRNHCTKCDASYPLEFVLKSNKVPLCQHCKEMIKPDVVLYGEQLDDNNFNKATTLISQADVLIVGGTSLAVYPAAGLIKYFSGIHLVIINKTKTPYDSLASLIINDSIGKILWDNVQSLNE